MNGRLRLTLSYLLCALLTGSHIHPAAAQAKPEGEMRWALYVTVAPAWFDPGESVAAVVQSVVDQRKSMSTARACAQDEQ